MAKKKGNWAVSMAVKFEEINWKRTPVQFPRSRNSCYRNAAMAAMTEGWLYIEGFASGGAPFAWNMNGDNFVDITAEQYKELRGKKVLYEPKMVKTPEELRAIYSDGSPFRRLMEMKVGDK